MSRNYKFHNSEGVYFISFAVVEWLDVFTRNEYKTIVIDSLHYCQKEKGMEIFAWCIMTNHVHLIFRSKNEQKPELLIGDLKRFTSKEIVKAIIDNRSCEREVVGSTTTQYIWIGGDAYTAVAVAKKVGTGAWTVYNIFRDHLGTITHLKTGSTINEYSFDAWGRRRDKDTWSYSLSDEPALFAERGFTAHEHLEDFKLINMNGRLYDPVVGRFLSPDPYVQDPTNSQSFNRYSYCLNNPLKYNDPSGDKWDWTILNPFHYLDNIMQWVNDKTPKLRQKMVDAKIPAFGAGVNSANGSFHYFGNSGNIYHNSPGNNASAVVNGAINEARAEYYAYHNWEPYGLDNVLGQQFIGLSPALTMNPSSNGNGKGLLDKINFIAGFKATVISIGYEARLQRLSMYRPLTGMFERSGSSLWLSASKVSNAAKGFGAGTVGIGIGYDYLIGVPRYQRGIRDGWVVSPQKAAINTGVSLYSLKFAPHLGIVYFGYEAFYPGGFLGASQAATEADERMMEYDWYNYFNKY